MRKLLYTALLALGCLGAHADEAKLITTEASAVSAGATLTHALLQELFNTGKHFAFVNTNASAQRLHVICARTSRRGGYLLHQER